MKLIAILFVTLFLFQTNAKSAKSGVDLYKAVEKYAESNCKAKSDKAEQKKCLSSWNTMMVKDCGGTKKAWENCFFDFSPQAKYKKNNSGSWVVLKKELNF